MIDALNRANYLLTGDYTLARTLSICIIAITILFVLFLLFKLFRIRQKAICIAVSAIMVSFSVSSCFFLAPLHMVRYNGTFEDYKPIDNVADTMFTAQFKGIRVAIPREENVKYCAYVGSSNTTVVVIACPDGVSPYVNKEGTLMMVSSSDPVTVKYYKITGTTFTESTVDIFMGGTNITSISALYGVIKTELPVYNYNFTQLLYEEGYSVTYEPD